MTDKFNTMAYVLSPSDKLVPYDGVPNTVIDTVPASLVVVIHLLAIAGMVFALGCLAFNFAYRKTRSTCFPYHDTYNTLTIILKISICMNAGLCK